MRIHFKQLLRTFILGGFTAYFIQLHYTGDIEKFINPKYDLTSKIAAGIFAFFFFVQLLRVWEIKHRGHDSCINDCDHHHDSGSWMKRFIGHAIIIFPLVTGFLLSPVTLDASIAAKKNSILDRTNQTESNEESSDSTDVRHQIPMPNDNYFAEDEFDQAMEEFQETDMIQMEDQMYGAYYETIEENPKNFIGKKIKMNGFVYREDDFKSNQLILARFYMIHCVADTRVIGFLSEFEEAGKMEEDTWLEIEGTLDITTYHEAELPVIRVEGWTVIDEPEDPYVYPPIIQLVGEG